MNVQQLVEQFQSAGVMLSLVEDQDDVKVRLTPRSQAPDALVAALRDSKADVVALLRREQRPAPGPEQASAAGADPPVDAALASPFAQSLARQLVAWADTNRDRWRRIHSALIAIYQPVHWDRTDGTDILVMWVAARLGEAQARHELTRLEGLRRRLEDREAIAKAAREADLTLWQRIARKYQDKIPAALTVDVAAAKVIRQIVQRRT